MSNEEFLEQWNKRPDEDTDIELKEGDLFTILSGFAFVIQKDGNVICKKITDENRFLLREVFRMFRFFCKFHGITHIRVEGSKKRYNFLPKMFPFCSFVRDEEIKEKNVFFVKL
ncbi:MAG: hypothetical protein KBT21_08685 [Treponema sp.]|nr:hypothetical protein [Candidatus Treponema merdequi]